MEELTTLNGLNPAKRGEVFADFGTRDKILELLGYPPGSVDDRKLWVRVGDTQFPFSNKQRGPLIGGLMEIF
ncbi:hypothetical protein GF362_06645 [Candidatus Dojkabacteria bacterium]|nr:hypothetical protein [Candidatus Dojkabacteria bacterium]